MGKLRNVLPVWIAVLGLAVSVVHAQNNTIPPDQQAFRAARLLDDPQLQLDALKKVAADYPDSRYGERARMAVLDVLAKRFPSRSDELLRYVDVLLRKADPADPGPYDDVALVLVDAGVLLNKARALSEKTVRAFTEKAYIRQLKREYAEAKMPVPDQAELHKSYLRTRAALLGTLGRIYLKLGEFAQAQKTFEEAERADATSTAAEGLGAIALAEGREVAAYEYLVRARITGVLSPENTRALHMLYGKRHDGRIDTLEATLDEAYRKLGGNPVHAEPFNASTPIDRVALVEVFTGAGCPPCAGADLAIDAIRERFNSRQAVVLMHHVHIPRPDPMTNPDTVRRSDFYAVAGAPTYVVDGTQKATGGGSREDANRPYTRVNAMIEQALREPAGARLMLTGSVKGRTVTVQARPSLTRPTDKATLNVVLVERELRYSGENGIRFHPMVVRAMKVSPLESEEAGTVTAEFDVNAIAVALQIYLDEFERRNDRFGPIKFVEKLAAIDERNLGVVAFVQNDTDQRVLQAAFLDLAIPSETRR